jgi:hypothetical protein
MKRIAILAMGIALMLPSVALAESSTCQAYNSQICSEVSTQTTSTDNDGTLPFTGVDVVLLAAGGATLLCAGFVVRRVSRRLN